MSPFFLVNKKQSTVHSKYQTNDSYEPCTSQTKYTYKPFFSRIQIKAYFWKNDSYDYLLVF